MVEANTTMADEAPSNDLPLSANLRDITVSHFILDLTCLMDKHLFTGSVILWCRPTVEKKAAGEQEPVEDEISMPSGKLKCAETTAEEREEQKWSVIQNTAESLELEFEMKRTETDSAETRTEVCEVGAGCESVEKSLHCTDSGCSSCNMYKDCADCKNCQKGILVDENLAGGRMDGEHSTNSETVDSLESAPTTSSVGFACVNNCLCCVHNTEHIQGQKNSDRDSSLTINPFDKTFQHHIADRNIGDCSTTEQSLTQECVQLQSNCQPDKTDINRVKENQCAEQDPAVLTQLSESISAKQNKPFRMILDSYKLDVHKAEGIFLQGEDKSQFEEKPEAFVQCLVEKDMWSKYLHHPMEFAVEEHCIHVFMKTAETVEQFPQAVKIWYSTQSDGPSVKWTNDQDDNACAFTIGHFLSNRSLFPSQDFPTALPTWHATVTVDDPLTVLLTGDEAAQVTTTGDGKKRFSYFTRFPMPSSTFAIAVGQWGVETLSYPSLSADVENPNQPPVRLFFPKQLKERCVQVLGSYLPCCLLEVQRILGTYPLHRLDVLLVPACFDSLGMASPSLLFLSQSLLCEDRSMSVRVAHELCHTWFGIVMGPLDWTEEWMTEGFCTYLEDILHAQVAQRGETTEDYIRLRAQLHLRVLSAELQNTDENLQSLRPNKGRVDDARSADEETHFLKNGMNVEKKFMQVHYLKGYFLLRALETKVGRPQFLSFLKEYVQRYIYQLVTSQDFLQMFFDTFPSIQGLSVEDINRQWLDCPGMPEELKLMQGELAESTSADNALSTQVNQQELKIMQGELVGSTSADNALSTQVNQQLVVIVEACRRQTRRKRRRGRQAERQLPVLEQMVAPQVMLLFDRLLEEEQVPGHVLDLMKRVHGRHFDNAEVFHRWCELVVKHRHKKCYRDLEQFLLNHQAMGVYLYGEAMISGCRDLIHLARTSFRQLQHDMPESVRQTVSAMLFAT